MVSEDHPANSMAFTSSTPVSEEGMTFVFNSWICTADGLSSYRSHLADLREPGTLMELHDNNINSHNSNNETRLSDLFRYYSGHVRANPQPRISVDDLLAGIDRIDRGIADCIKSTEIPAPGAVLPHPGYFNFPILNQACALLPPRTSNYDIFSGGDRVDRSISDCIKLTKATLLQLDLKEPELGETEFNHDFDNFFDNLTEDPPPRTPKELEHQPKYKTLPDLKDDMDHLL